MVEALRAAARRSALDVESSPRVETAGCDFLWRNNGQWWGVQRKELNDFIASLNDGRLTKEVGQMKASVALPVVVIEGKIRFIHGVLASSSGYGRGREITEDGWQGRLLSLMHMGVHVQYTADRDDTARWVCAYYGWSSRPDHHTASTRPMERSDYWGNVSNEDFQMHMLTSLPGIGPKLALRIIRTVGMPLTLGVGVDELMMVEGLGAKKAQQIVKVFNG